MSVEGAHRPAVSLVMLTAWAKIPAYREPCQVPVSSGERNAANGTPSVLTSVAQSITAQNKV